MINRFRSWAIVPLLVLLTGLSARGDERPNFVIIFIDDMGWGDFSCFGNTEAQTPNIDQVAAEGIRFEQFYVNSPICSPSRCALTTGQYPQRWNIHSYLDNRQANERRGCANWLDPQAPTLPRLLQQSGYATGHFGKWHLGGQRDVDNAPEILEYGFDRSLTNFEGMGPKLLPLTMRPGDQMPGRIWADAERLGGPFTWTQRSEITGGFVREAIEFAKHAQSLDQPFYINLWPDDVHSPFWPPVSQWREGKREKYLAVLEAMDAQLGPLFELLRTDQQLRANTLVMICSDNGPEPGAGNAGPFRGAKTTLYEGGVRSPLIVWGPGIVNSDCAGSTDLESVIAAFDFAPTLLEIAEVSHASVEFDGESMVESLLGRGRSVRREPLFWRRPPDRKVASPGSTELLPDLAMREGNWKLLCNYDGSEPQLYDLAVDRSEKNNLAASNPDLLARMMAALLEWHHSLPEDRGEELGADVIQRLRDRER